MSTTRRITLPALALLAAATFIAAPAEAQNNNQPAVRAKQPPQPRRAEGVPFYSYGAVIVVMVAPLLVNFISSKRGHQD